MNQKKTSLQTTNGFTLIEVLVALLVMSVGLLGLAALQATSLKTNHGAYNRGQAIFLAYDMMDRMRANQINALAEAYDRNIGDAIPAAGGGLANNDSNSWMINLQQALPGPGDAAIDCVPATRLCTIVIQWDEARLGGSTQALANDFDGNADTIDFTITSEI